MIYHFSFLIPLLLLLSCRDDITPPTVETSGVVVVNSLGRSLSSLDPETGVVVNDFFTTGPYPNDVLFHDGKLWVAVSGSNTIDVLDTSGFQKTATIQLGVGTNPYSLVRVNDTLIAVSLLLVDSVAFIHSKRMKPVFEVPAGKNPQGLVTGQWGQVYVANSGYNLGRWDLPSVSRIDVASRREVARIPVPRNPQAVAVDMRGNIHVACTGDYQKPEGRIYVLDPMSMIAFDSLAFQGNPSSLAYDAGKDHMMFCDYSLLAGVYDAFSMDGLETYEYSLREMGVENLYSARFDQLGNLWFVDFNRDRLYRMSDIENTTADSWIVGDGPVAFTFFQ